MFKIRQHRNNTFTIAVTGSDGSLQGEFTLATIGYHKWNELGMMVVEDEAPLVKNPKNLNEYIPDLKAQAKLNAAAEMTRNAMRVVWALEHGEGIDWDGQEPDTLEAKAEAIQNIDATIFMSLISGLRAWLYNTNVSIKDTVEGADADLKRFQDVPTDDITDMSSEKAHA